MKLKKPRKILHIRFHNPNTSEETEKFLVKIIAKSISDKIISR